MLIPAYFGLEFGALHTFTWYLFFFLNSWSDACMQHTHIPIVEYVFVWIYIFLIYCSWTSMGECVPKMRFELSLLSFFLGSFEDTHTKKEEEKNWKKEKTNWEINKWFRSAKNLPFLKHSIRKQEWNAIMLSKQGELNRAQYT